jgi:peptidoglycan hydrolase-like protein with peptidoglycan-binding domain
VQGGLRKILIATCGALVLMLTVGFFGDVKAATYVVEKRYKVYRTKQVERYSVRSVQRALYEAGYRVTVDGRMGPQTRVVLREFQRDHGMPPSGRVNRETLTKLGL